MDKLMRPFDPDLAIRLSKIIHDRWTDAPHDIGAVLAQEAYTRTPAPAEVERLVDRINDELFCGALKRETKSRLLAALSNTTPYLSRDVNVPVEEEKESCPTCKHGVATWACTLPSLTPCKWEPKKAGE